MSTPPPIQLPGQGFSLWARPLTAQPSVPPARYHLGGQQFTIWTRPRPRAVAARIEAAAATAAPDTKPMNWLSRAALLALPVIAGAWYFDHGQQSEQAQVLFQAAQSHAQNDQRLQTELASLTKSLAEKAALLAELETKQQTTSVERDGAKTALATAQQALKLATAEATSQSMELTKLTEALTVQRKAAAEQESALKTTLNSLRAEASQFKQTMEQQALETQNVLAKADAEKAAAIHEAAAAAGQVRELSAQLAQWMKDHPVVEPSAK